MIRHTSKIIGAAIFGCAFLSTTLYVGARIVRNIQFNQHIGGHLKLAADANSISLAKRELGIALDRLHDDGTCPGSGHTSVLYRTPDEDVGFWCDNLGATLSDLQATPDDVDGLTESNQLIKVRETLLDHGDSGDAVTAPSGISVYPHNVAVAWWGWLSLLGWPVGFVVMGPQQ